MTLDRILINLSEREFSNGLTYTAVTRARRLCDIAFRPFPNFVRYIKVLAPCHIISRSSNFRIARIFGTSSFKERLTEEERKINIINSGKAVQRLKLSDIDCIRDETCLEDSEALLDKLIASFEADNSTENSAIVGELALRILLKLDLSEATEYRRVLIKKITQFCELIDENSVQIERLKLTEIDHIRDETCLEDSEALLKKLIASFENDSSAENTAIVGELAFRIVLKLDHLQASKDRKIIIKKVLQFCELIDGSSEQVSSDTESLKKNFTCYCFASQYMAVHIGIHASTALLRGTLHMSVGTSIRCANGALNVLL